MEMPASFELFQYGQAVEQILSDLKSAQKWKDARDQMGMFETKSLKLAIFSTFVQT